MICLKYFKRFSVTAMRLNDELLRPLQRNYLFSLLLSGVPAPLCKSFEPWNFKWEPAEIC